MAGPSTCYNFRRAPWPKHVNSEPLPRSHSHEASDRHTSLPSERLAYCCVSWAPENPWKCPLRLVPQKKNKLFFNSQRLALMVMALRQALAPDTPACPFHARTTPEPPSDDFCTLLFSLLLSLQGAGIYPGLGPLLSCSDR